jgi:exonuclease III
LGEKSKRKDCVQSVTTYLSKLGESLLDLLAHNTFNECAKTSKHIGKNLYKKINLDQSNSEDIRCGFKAALRCLEAAVYVLMDVLRAHNQRITEKLANMSVVSSYHSTITEVRDQSYFKKTNAFRDLMKAQNDKANKLEALIEIGDLTNETMKN